MPFGDVYYRQAALLIRAIPHVAHEICFALKGGTAINLFIRDMPRLSVDLDLTYLPVEPRPESLAAIDAAMKRIATRVRAGIGGARVTETRGSFRLPIFTLASWLRRSVRDGKSNLNCRIPNGFNSPGSRHRGSRIC